MKKDFLLSLLNVYLPGILQLLLFAWVAWGQLSTLAEIGDNLSPIADSFSEANTLRAGQGYYREGFFSNSGLPDLLYGKKFPQAGVPSEPTLAGLTTFVYTHYPQGAEVAVGINSYIFGENEHQLFRLFPVGVGLFSWLFFAQALCFAVGPWGSVMVMFFLSRIPMMTNMMHGLHQHSYETSMLWIIWGILLKHFFAPETTSRKKASWVIFFCAFTNGWLSFDISFLTIFSAIPLWFFARLFEKKIPLSTLVCAIFFCGAGFSFAHGLHFLDVIAYRGSLANALQDFRDSYRFRSGASSYRPTLRELYEVYRDTYFDSAFVGGQALLDARYFLGFGFILGGLRFLALGDSGPAFVKRVLMTKLPFLLGCAISTFVVCYLWIMTIRQHGIAHSHFLPRHGILIWIMLALLMVRFLLQRYPEYQRTEEDDD